MTLSERQDAEILYLVLKQMADDGFDTYIAGHGTWGYTALFWKDTGDSCFVCDQPPMPNTWEAAGHDATILDAVLEARAIAIGATDGPRFPPEHFASAQ